MMPYLNTVPMEHLWWLLWWVFCSWDAGICAGQPAPAAIVLTNAEIVATLLLSLTGLFVWLRLLTRVIYWILVSRRRKPTLEELIVEFTQAQDANADDLTARGVNSAPTFVVGDELFRGRQHLPMIRWILGGRAGPGPI